ncbi:unnamed protein product, partial [Laminaria digitata]
MQVFSIHLRPAALTPDRDAVLVKEGFCWPAFFFGPFWALWHRMWFAFAGLLSILIALGLAEAALRLDPTTYSAVMFGVATIIGFCGNDWRRNALADRGWKMEGLSAAPDHDLALRRFIDLHPDAMDMR